MDVKTAVRDQAKYPDIVAWFCSLGDLDAGQMVLLADTIGEMSDQIYEHHRALCDLLKSQLQRVRRACQEKGCQEAFPDRSVRQQLSYVVSKACSLRAVLPEKYEELQKGLDK